MNPRILVALVAGGSLLGLAGPAFAAERTHPIVADDYFTIAYTDAAVLSPDGSRIVYTEKRWEPEEDARNTDLWVLEVRSREVRRLTFDPAADLHPIWSPDGEWIYFQSSRTRGDGEKPPHNDKSQVWRIAAAGGDIVPITRLARGVRDFAISADGTRLYYTTEIEQLETDPWKPLRESFKDLEYGHGVEDLTELWVMELSTFRARRLVEATRVIFDFRVAPDGSRVALLTRPEQELISNEGWSRVEILDVAGGTVTPLPDAAWREEAPSPYGWILAPCWSSDSRTLAFRVDFDGYPGEVFFAHFDGGATPVIGKLHRPGEVTVAGAMGWMPGTRTFCFEAVDRARRRVMAVEGIRASGQGEARVLTPGDVVVDAFTFAPTGRLAVIMSGLDHPPDLFLVRSPGPRGRYERLTTLNPQVDTWRVPRLEIVQWTSPDGTPVEGILELPPGYRPEDGPLPLLVNIHGGPTDTDYFRFQFWIYGRTLFSAQGWATLLPNYRGSIGYGDAFLSALIGNKNRLDVMDIQSGVDALIERGIADPERMAVMGWSNGGYLTNCLITRDSRFKAASSGAGVFDTAMEWSIEDTPGHVINFNQGLPWEREEEMRRTSPLFAADGIRTPTLIHVGEKDERVPAEHARSLYRALRYYRKIPTELVVYPGAGHTLLKYSHRRAKLQWDERWLNHYVLGKPDPDLE